jgi:hypothetical protein
MRAYLVFEGKPINSGKASLGGRELEGVGFTLALTLSH